MAETSLTYQLNQNTKRINTMIDGVDAIEQMVLKAMDTERFYYLIYSWVYGIELEAYIGKEFDFIKTDIKSKITSCLQVDDRILTIENFKCIQNPEKPDEMALYFECVTPEGVIPITKEGISV